MQKIKKIVLLESKTAGLNIFSAAKLPRIGIVLIGTILKKMGYDIKIFCEDFASIDYNEIRKADLVGISAVTPTSTRSYKIIKEIKKVNSKIPIIMGGPHPSFLPEEALDLGADFVVRGEGEKTIIELIEMLEGRKNPHEIKGLSFKSNENYVHTPDREFMNNLDELPFPDWTLVENYKAINYIPIQTSRGCPFGCKFCTVIKLFGRKYRYRSVEKVFDEIRYLIDIFKGTKAKRIFFYDDNFSANRSRIKKLLNKIIDEKIKMPTWFSQERLDLSEDEELVALMAKTGCKRIMAGIESVNPKTLEEYNKNQSVEEIQSAIKVFHKHGIGIHGMFVLGSENDDIDSIKKTMGFIVENKIDTVQVLILTPFPGTGIYDELKEQGRIIFDGPDNWYLYDGHHVVHQPNLIAPWDLQAKVSIEVLSTIYSYYRALSFAFERNVINGLIVIKSNMVQKQWAKINKDFMNKIKAIQLGPYNAG